jgi:xanthine dehydrogenase YagT iron-sulfur-binding subunit
MKKPPQEDNVPSGQGVTRRGFLASMGAGAVAATTGGRSLAESQAHIVKPEELTKITLVVNGHQHRVLVEPRWSLLFVLREKLGMTGTKMGCDRGECGACTVLINDVPRYSCLTLAVEAEGKSITTIEGLVQGEELGLVQEAFAADDAFQCGYCTPGQIMAVEGLLLKNPDPSLDEIRFGVSGNLCRCGNYRNIFQAAGKAAQLKRGQGGRP